MGLGWNKLSPYFSKQDDIQILMFGRDEAGKTTILGMTKLSQIETTMPTIGFVVETVSHKNITLTAWDLGGRTNNRPLWRYYYKTASAFIFVIDSHDRDLLGDACSELHKMANEDDLKNKPILIFANKQDLPNALSLDVLKEKLNLSKLDEMNTKWHLQAASAINNEGIIEGFDWLANTIRKKIDLKQPIIETINDSKKMKNDLLSIWNSIGLKSLLNKFAHY